MKISIVNNDPLAPLRAIISISQENDPIPPTIASLAVAQLPVLTALEKLLGSRRLAQPMTNFWRNSSSFVALS